MGADANDALLGRATAKLEEFNYSKDDPSAKLDERSPGNGAAFNGSDRTSHETRPKDCGLGISDAGDDLGPIQPRGWLLGNTFCRKFSSSIISPGGVGKTALRTAQALSLATGRELTGEHVFHRARVLYVSLEDDHDELRRRIRAAMIHYQIDFANVKDWFFFASITGKAWKLTSGDKPAELVHRLNHDIAEHRIDLVIIDPFVKSHDVDENNNRAIDGVASVASQIAIDHNCAIDLPHHTNKLPSGPGNANSARGASSFKDAGRLSYTLTPMCPDEAKLFGLSEEERRSLVRVDSAKVNLVPGSPTAKWFRLVSVDLDNATEEYPHGDNIQVAELWTPPDMWKDLPIPVCCRIIDEIDAGLDKGERFSGSSAAKGRAAWPIVRKHVDKLTATQARKVISTWVENGVLVEREYHSTTERKDRTGLFANPDKRPGARQ